MSLSARLRTVFLCAVLELGALTGVPMPPEKIRELMNQMNQPKMAHVLRKEDENGRDSTD